MAKTNRLNKLIPVKKSKSRNMKAKGKVSKENCITFIDAQFAKHEIDAAKRKLEIIERLTKKYRDELDKDTDDIDDQDQNEMMKMEEENRRLIRTAMNYEILNQRMKILKANMERSEEYHRRTIEELKEERLEIIRRGSLKHRLLMKEYQELKQFLMNREELDKEYEEKLQLFEDRETKHQQKLAAITQNFENCYRRIQTDQVQLVNVIDHLNKTVVKNNPANRMKRETYTQRNTLKDLFNDINEMKSEVNDLKDMLFNNRNVCRQYEVFNKSLISKIKNETHDICQITERIDQIKTTIASFNISEKEIVELNQTVIKLTRKNKELRDKFYKKLQQVDGLRVKRQQLVYDIANQKRKFDLNNEILEKIHNHCKFLFKLLDANKQPGDDSSSYNCDDSFTKFEVNYFADTILHWLSHKKTSPDYQLVSSCATLRSRDISINGDLSKWMRFNKKQTEPQMKLLSIVSSYKSTIPSSTLNIVNTVQSIVPIVDVESDSHELTDTSSHSTVITEFDDDIENESTEDDISNSRPISLLIERGKEKSVSNVLERQKMVLNVLTAIDGPGSNLSIEAREHLTNISKKSLLRLSRFAKWNHPTSSLTLDPEEVVHDNTHVKYS